ncbi:hypothetical protein Tco_1122034 [Tanacetum coccineum]|uniref:Uncharacterized protein n=1 Tax=Tanacetum coccineum TaxID=301880 RepID=A0ABQ5IZF5_9ASTR
MNRLMAKAKKPKLVSGSRRNRSLLSRLAPWNSGLYNVVTNSSGYLGVPKLFGVDSPSWKIECSLPSRSRCSCYLVAANVPLSRLEPLAFHLLQLPWAFLF